MALSDERWVEVTPSQFDHEAEGLGRARDLIPDASPFRAWSNFEFRDGHGRWHEVDLLVLGRGRLHLVELKYYAGIIRGDEHTWLRDGRRAEDSPIKLARRKAQRLASRMTDELLLWAKERDVPIRDTRDVVPFVIESVLLHHPRFSVDMPESGSFGLFCLDGAEGTSNLPGIRTRLLEAPHGRPITKNQEQMIALLLDRMGLVPRRERTAGSWVIEESLVGEGEGWQDWRAYHQHDQGQHSRIRFQIPPQGASTSDRRELDQIVRHEFRTMSRLVHDGLLRPTDLVESDLGLGLVYPWDESLVRLDLWLAQQEDGAPLETRLDLVRQIAEAVHYAHGNSVAHRALSPEAIYVREHPDGSLKALVGEWQSSGRAAGETQTGSAARGITMLHRSSTDEDHLAAFRAPEGAWQATATDRLRLDVFGLGALTYYLLTGQHPATSAQALRERLRTQAGIDVSPDLPEASEALRTLILGATRPSPSERTSDIAVFLEQLAEAERAPERSESPDLDPLDAKPGDLLGGRFTLVRRLGRGSTAVGLLVSDGEAEDAQQLVLKVAIDDAAARRLADEADVLRLLDSPRLVRIVDGPLTVGGRSCLLLESAGPQTLAEVLRERARLSLDLLERYGTDLLQGLQALDKAGVDHRDIKPANLGVRESRGDRTKHLVLFDFSLTRAAAAATDAGTPPYLDPFLGTDARPRYDSAAERYAAAVVLFEMATGTTPRYGDSSAHPAAVPDELTLHESDFDSSAAPALVPFFRTALARDAKDRHNTIGEMLQAWESALTQTTTIPDDAEQLAANVRLDTPLSQSGMTAREVSALEPLGLTTVGDLVIQDPVVLTTLSGVAHDTRTKVRQRAKEWRLRFKDAIQGLVPKATSSHLPSPQDAVDLFLAHAGRTDSARAMARLLLGIGDNIDPFATNEHLAGHLPTPVTQARASQLITGLQRSWAKDADTQHLLVTLDGLVRGRLDELGSVATIDELSTSLLQAMAPTGTPQAATQGQEHQLARGLLRVTLDRQRALARADEEVQALLTRRRGDRMSLIATDIAMIDLAEALAREADRLVAAETGKDHDSVVPADLAHARLAAVQHDSDSQLEATRMLQLAAAASHHAQASGAGELHHHDLPSSAAVALTLRGIAPQQGLSPSAIQDRVAARFPGLDRLPPRPKLDGIVAGSGIGLVYDSDQGVYRPIDSAGDTTGLETRQPTRTGVALAPVSSTTVVDERLRTSRDRRSFLALGVQGHRYERAIRRLEDSFGASTVNVTDVLMRAVKRQAEERGMAWATVEAADAAAPGSRPAQGLALLVKSALSEVTEAIGQAASSADGDGPVLVTDAAPLARYDHLDVLTQWTDLSIPRERAVWLLVPQLRANRGATLDGHPVFLSSPGQFVHLDLEWLDADHVSSATHHHGGMQ